MSGIVHPVALARAYRSMTQAELGRRIGRSRNFVTKLEKGELDVAPLVRELALACDLPPAFFNNEPFFGPVGAISYRKRSNCPSAIRDRASFFAVIAASRLEVLVSQYVHYPSVDMLSLEVDWDTAMDFPQKVGAKAARALREHWNLGWGPIANVTRLLESKGIRMFAVPEQTEHLDGFAFWTEENKPFILLNSHFEDTARLRFDALHEAGHLAMHRQLDMNRKTDVIELMAHGFAAEFLAPWEIFRREAPLVPTLDRLHRLKLRWGMSMQAIVKHMHVNGAISDTAYTNAFRRFSSLGYRRGPEPGWIEPEPSVMHAAFLRAVEARGESVATVAESIGVPEKLLGGMVPQSTRVGQFGLSLPL